MSLSVSSSSLQPGLQAYQQSKLRGEDAKQAPDGRALLRAEQEALGLSQTPQVAPPETPMTREQRLELERSWGLISAFLGTQVDIFV